MGMASRPRDSRSRPGGGPSGNRAGPGVRAFRRPFAREIPAGRGLGPFAAVVLAPIVALALVLVLAGGAGCVGGALRDEGRPPNVLLILADDLGYRDLGFMGATEIETPNLDRLAAEGVRFESGYVAHPVCAPSRAGLLTGRYPARFGMDGNLGYAPFDPHEGLPVGETTFVESLRAAGYRTGMVGKWHLGAAPEFLPRVRGFEEFTGFLDGVHYYWGRDIDAGDPSAGARAPITADGIPVRLRADEYLTDFVTDRALDFLRGPFGSPFFLYVSYNAPHRPLQAPPELVAKYAGVGSDHRARYLAMVDSLDRNVGRLLEELETTALRRDTVVFFLSDNGGVHPARSGPSNDFADNGPLRDGKGSLFEGGIRVPFVASWPGRWPAGAAYPAPVISLDIAATALALAGVAPEQPLDGVNLDPFLRGEASGAPHEALFWRNGFEYAVRGPEWKLVLHEDAPPALYRPDEDPGETRDRLGSAGGEAERLAGLWTEWNRPNAGPRFRSRGEYERILSGYLDDRAASLREITAPEECQIRAEVGGAAPAAPVGLRAAGEDGALQLRWERAGDPGSILGWEVRFRAAGGGEWSAWRRLYGTTGCTTGTRVDGLENGRRHQVELRAWNAAGPGAAAGAAATPDGP